GVLANDAAACCQGTAHRRGFVLAVFLHAKKALANVYGNQECLCHKRFFSQTVGCINASGDLYSQSAGSRSATKRRRLLRPSRTPRSLLLRTSTGPRRNQTPQRFSPCGDLASLTEARGSWQDGRM